MPRIFPISMSNPKTPRKPPTHPCTWWNVDPWRPPPPPPLTMCVEVALPVAVAVAVALAAIWDRCGVFPVLGSFWPILPRPLPFARCQAFVCSVADATVQVFISSFSTQLPETRRSETEAQRMHQTASQRTPEDPRVSAASLGEKMIFKEKGKRWRQQVGECTEENMR